MPLHRFLSATAGGRETGETEGTASSQDGAPRCVCPVSVEERRGEEQRRGEERGEGRVEGRGGEGG